MNKILIINTGGTFNKIYNPIKGELQVPVDAKVLENILCYFYGVTYEIKNILHKDSLEMTEEDRKAIVEEINKNNCNKILIVHGTDTIDKTAEFLDKQIKTKIIVLTGAMVPFSIDAIEATANFSLALTSLMLGDKNGIFIAIHGLIAPYQKIYKNRIKGRFELKKE
ncbi:MAG: asparaginase domain-containing protein [Sulfurospirillaceae bacterium]|nr:asparaginase domain-containing protein [Sulfurospirillaceae bacterium]MDD3462248.1 asparaginase domain-containing protein [Sulfurospirillaceae bacterium]